MKKYFCLKCKRTHFRGKIYEDHLEYREKKSKKNNPNHKTKNPIPSNEIIEFDFDELRPIARRQIQRCILKMHQTKHFGLYIKEINRIILHEKQL